MTGKLAKIFCRNFGVKANVRQNDPMPIARDFYICFKTLHKLLRLDAVRIVSQGL